MGRRLASQTRHGLRHKHLRVESGWADVEINRRSEEAVKVGHTPGISLNIMYVKGRTCENKLVTASSKSWTLLV